MAVRSAAPVSILLTQRRFIRRQHLEYGGESEVLLGEGDEESSFLEETCCSWDRRNQVCTHCGARRHVRAFSGPGLDWTYHAAVNEGPVSRFVQAIDGHPCSHQWKSYDFAGGGMLFGWLGSGGGRRGWLSAMEGTYPDLEALLYRRASMDPTFTARFLDVIHTDDYGRYEQFLNEFMAWAQSQTSRPGNEGTGPASGPG